jgi:hypothetical protein
MGNKWKAWLPVGILTSSLLIWSAGLGALTFEVVVGSSTSFNGLPVTLAFDYIDGGSPDNTVTLSALTFSADWIPDGAPSDSPAGSVCGLDLTCPPPWTFMDAGGACSFCELQVPFSAMGTTLSFSFTTTDNPPDPGSSPDSFSFFILDPDTGLALFPTSDTTGADALFLFNIGGAGDCDLSLCVYSPVPAIEGFSLSVTPVTPAPEPGTLALLAAGFGALLRRRRLT